MFQQSYQWHAAAQAATMQNNFLDVRWKLLDQRSYVHSKRCPTLGLIPSQVPGCQPVAWLRPATCMSENPAWAGSLLPPPELYLRAWDPLIARHRADVRCLPSPGRTLHKELQPVPLLQLHKELQEKDEKKDLEKKMNLGCNTMSIGIAAIQHIIDLAASTVDLEILETRNLGKNERRYLHTIKIESSNLLERKSRFACLAGAFFCFLWRMVLGSRLGWSWVVSDWAVPNAIV